MSTCPNKDIHSIYLDNELPAQYLASYEEHIKSCPECQKQLESLKAVKELFQKDDEQVINYHSTEQQLDDSYKRLQARLSYSKITGVGKSQKTLRMKHLSSLGYMATGVAAALVVAFVIPLKNSNKAIETTALEATYFEPIARTSFEQNVSNRSYINQNLSNAVNVSALSELSDTSRTLSNNTESGMTLVSTTPNSFASYDLLGTKVTSLPYKINTNEGFSEFYEMELKRLNEEIQKMNFIFTFNSLYNNEDYFIGN